MPSRFLLDSLMIYRYWSYQGSGPWSKCPLVPREIGTHREYRPSSPLGPLSLPLGQYSALIRSIAFRPCVTLSCRIITSWWLDSSEIWFWVNILAIMINQRSHSSLNQNMAYFTWKGEHLVQGSNARILRIDSPWIYLIILAKLVHDI